MCSQRLLAERLGAGAQLHPKSIPQHSLTRSPKSAFFEGALAAQRLELRRETECQSWGSQHKAKQPPAQHSHEQQPLRAPGSVVQTTTLLLPAAPLTPFLGILEPQDETRAGLSVFLWVDSTLYRVWLTC